LCTHPTGATWPPDGARLATAPPAAANTAAAATTLALRFLMDFRDMALLTGWTDPAHRSGAAPAAGGLRCQ